MTIGPARRSDIPAIRAIEALPAYDGLVGRWPAKRHREEMSDPSSRYFLLRGADGEVEGFALLQGFDDPDLKVHLKRIAVRHAGAGLGSVLLSGVLARVYAETGVNRIDLDVFVGNDRARRAYEKAGFRLEGVLRAYHRNGDGSFSDMWLMSLLRRDWEAQSSARLPTSKL